MLVISPTYRWDTVLYRLAPSLRHTLEHKASFTNSIQDEAIILILHIRCSVPTKLPPRIVVGYSTGTALRNCQHQIAEPAFLVSPWVHSTILRLRLRTISSQGDTPSLEDRPPWAQSRTKPKFRPWSPTCSCGRRTDRDTAALRIRMPGLGSWVLTERTNVLG